MKNWTETKTPVRSGSAQVKDVLGVRVDIQISGEDTAGAFSQYECHVPPGGGPPPHIHSVEDETFYVLEGEFEILCGEDRFIARVGDYAYAPKGLIHTFKNVGNETGRLLSTSSPAGHELFFEEVDHLSQSGPLSVEEVIAVCARHGMTVPAPPVAVAA